MPKKNDPKIEKRKDELLGLFLITFAAISIFAVFSSSAGLIGNTLKSAYYYLVGVGSYLLPFIFIYWGVQLIRSKKIKISLRFIGFIIIFISIISIIDLNNLKNRKIISIGGRHTGGIIGGSISSILVKLFAYNGAYIILSVFMLIGLLLFFDLFLHNIFKKIKAALLLPKKLYELLIEKWNELVNNLSKAKNSIIMNIKSKFKFKKEKKNNEENLEKAGSSSKKVKKTYTKNLEPENLVEENRNDKELREDFDISRDQLKNIKAEGEKHGDYTLPGISLLNDDGRKKAKLANKSELLEETLSSFGVDAEVINVNHGPKITRYEIQPAVGVKVSKIVTLSDDIALSLAAKDVRIEAPIPGKAAVGIEVPHGSDITVSFRDVVVSEEFQKTDNKLNLALGKGIDGDTEVFDLNKMPHLLVAGATGSGKSVCINTLICSILYRAAPDEVKLLLIDPKKVELNIYKGLPHLLTPVVTNPKKASNVLKLVVEEMEDRYDLFSDTGSRGIESYNNKMDSPEDKLPYIVVVIDELSDLMMVAANEVEDNICRLAQMSRAAGIHLIIATQRPSVDVITGLIKANIPSRISFAVSSATDSRTILDMGGAEKLLGKGDMLFAPVGVKKPIRIQGAFLTDKEINKIINFIKSQAKADYKIEKDDIKEVELSLDDDQDELYEEAVQLVVKYRASISMLQRRLHIGHSRAARLIDTMEEDGIVGPYAGSKPREVLVEEEDLEKILNDDYENTENIDN
ncbi:MAG: DNA translocase FtsK 4TM domain-containing protein [Halanaerobium sp.]